MLQIFKSGVTVHLANDGQPHRPARIVSEWRNGRGTVVVLFNDGAVQTDSVATLREMPEAHASALRHANRVHGCTLGGSFDA